MTDTGTCPRCGATILGEVTGPEAAEIERLREFARWAVTEGPFAGCDLDGARVQEQAVKYGILRQTKYDPEKKHGENYVGAVPGDDWFEFTFRSVKP